MKEKIKCILLIDDNEADNFFSELVINELDCAEKVVAVQSGQAALDYLTKPLNGVYPQPTLIFLDINMPAMNGWEFLAEYKKLNEHQKAQKVVVMLTTSLNPDDAKMAREIAEIDEFMNKPLTKEMLMEVLEGKFQIRV